MSNKKESGGYEVSNRNGQNEFRASGTWSIIGLLVLGGLMLRSAFDLGSSKANQVLRRHDKDVKMLEKKMRKEAKERLKREKREAKERQRLERQYTVHPYDGRML